MKKLFTLASWLLLLLLLAGPVSAQAQRLAAGQDFTLSIHPDGTLWAWGTNNQGQLGLGSLLAAGNYAYQAAPQQVGTASTWVSVSASYSHAAAIRTDGTLWVWGYNGSGQLGNGTSTGFQYSPVQVGTATWLSVSAGYNCTLAIRADGTLWAWGYNGYGETGLGTASNTSQLTPVQVGTATTWQSVRAGGGHALALCTDGTLWAWGYNDRGQLGNGLPGSAAPRYVANGGAVLASASVAPTATWALAPNPAHHHTRLLGLPTGPVALRLYDAQGRLARVAATAEVELAGLAPGLYLLHATAGPTTRTLRLAVE